MDATGREHALAGGDAPFFSHELSFERLDEVFHLA